ncbi:hypothetical protein [Rudaea sp. 3F27F6]|uniref:hypothetical protein n=1 Tax=Rudaea sp. 3F27F6 TaxID=2502208 RepID=UPI0010F50D0C|nr:hypothetical protein [Rudaea sp. 3F27F6]
MNEHSDAFTIQISEPSICSAAELAAFQALVRKGGEVDHRTLPALVEAARFLAFVKSDSLLVGVGAIKRPYASHRGKVLPRRALS